MHVNRSPSLHSSPQGFSLASQLEGEGRVGCVAVSLAHPVGALQVPPQRLSLVVLRDTCSIHSFIYKCRRHLLCVSHCDMAVLAGVGGSNPVASALEMRHEPDLTPTGTFP